jgi:SNF2 family DNA or RNA helicase
MDIDNEKRYSQAEDDFIHYLEKNRFSRRSIDSAMMAEYLVKRNHLRQLSLKGKLKNISQWLEELSEQTGEKILVAGNFSEPLEKLSIQFDAELLDGSKSAQQKRDIIKRWAKNKKQFMIANIQAVGTGTDGLQDACSVICVLDPTDKPSTMDQLISRLERIGQTKPVQVYMLFSSRTIDAHIWEAVKNKKRVTDAVNRGIDISENVDVDDAIVRAYLKRV